MDLSDTPSLPALPATPAGARLSLALAQAGSEAAGLLTAALERVDALMVDGRLDVAARQALRGEVASARRVAMLAQQLARHAAGRARQQPERLALADMLRDAADARRDDAAACSVQIRLALAPAEVVGDAPLLHALLDALIDWALPHAHGSLDFKLALEGRPLQARLALRVVHTPAADDASAHADALDTLAWCLLEQLADTMGLELARRDTAADAVLALGFPHTLPPPEDRPVEVSDARPLAGTHVLVLEPRREVRMQVRDAIAHMGLMVDFVASIDEARGFCEQAVPQALVHASAVDGERLDALCADVAARAPSFVRIVIDEEGDAFEVGVAARGASARVGRQALANGLPAALAFELSR